MLKGYKYELQLNNKQKEFFNKSFGCCRFVYNYFLDVKIREFRDNNINLDSYNLIKRLPILKNENLWLKEVANESLQQSILNLGIAYKNFFKHKKWFPKFKSKNSKQSVKFNQRLHINFEKGKIKVSKIGWIKCNIDRTFIGKIKSVVISKIPSGKYFASILVEDNTNKLPKCKITKSTSIGIDLGLKDFATTSNNDKYKNNKFLQKSESKLKILQKRHSRKNKGSKNKEKARLKVAKIHYKISCQRKDFLHKLSTKIVSENQTIILEDLNVQGMMKNHNLAKAISNVGWYEFYRQVQYKCDWYGKNLITIDRFEPTSKRCNNCKKINNDLKLKDRQWTCECGIIHDRDINAAINIKNAGYRKYVLSLRNSGKDIPVESMELSIIVETKKQKVV
jgi:putative transposase